MHVNKCPTAQSIQDSVAFSWTADVTEEGNQGGHREVT